MFVANKRSKDKIYIAGWVPVGLAAGIEMWLKKNPSKNRTDFMIASSLEKLFEAGIQVEIPADYSNARRRKELPASAFAMLKEVPVTNKEKPKA